MPIHRRLAYPLVLALLLAFAPSAGAQLVSIGGAGDAPVPCPKLISPLKLAARTAPSKADYLSLAERAHLDWGKQLDRPTLADADRVLKTASRPGFGSDFGTLLLAQSHGPLAIYLISWSAGRDAADAITANALGVALKSMHAYDPALGAFLYSNQLEAGQPLTLANLGHLALALGDGNSADTWFQQAIAVDPEYAPALVGLGSLAGCKGDRAGAERYLRRSLKKMYLPAAGAGLDIIMDPDMGGAAPGSAPGGGASQPIPHAGGGKAGGAPLSIPDPKLSGNVAEVAASYPALQEYADRGAEEALQTAQKIGAVGAGAQWSGSAAVVRTGNTRVAPYSYEKERFLLHDTSQIFSLRIELAYARMAEVEGPLEQMLLSRRDAIDATLNDKLGTCTTEACFQQAMNTACEAKNTLARSAHARYYPAWNQYWTQTKQALLDYTAFTAPWLADIRDPQMNKSESLDREMFVRTADNVVRLQTANWALQMQITWSGECAPVTAVDVPAPEGKLSLWPVDPAACTMPTVNVSFGIASFEGDCSKTKLEIGAGAFVSLTQKYGDQPKDDEITIHFGVGGKAKVPGTSAELKAQVGPYVTFKDGEFVDSGGSSSLSVKADMGPLAQVNAKAEARINSEFQTKVDFKPNLKLGGKL